MSSGSAGPYVPAQAQPEAASEDDLFDGAEDVTVSSQLWSLWPTAEDYLSWWSRSSGYRQNSSWWLPPPPSANEILADMKAEATQLLPRAPMLEPRVTVANIREHNMMATSGPNSRDRVLRDIERTTS